MSVFKRYNMVTEKELNGFQGDLVEDDKGAMDTYMDTK
jgi:hypothetical protein